MCPCSGARLRPSRAAPRGRGLRARRRRSQNAQRGRFPGLRPVGWPRRALGATRRGANARRSRTVPEQFPRFSFPLPRLWHTSARKGPLCCQNETIEGSEGSEGCADSARAPSVRLAHRRHVLRVRTQPLVGRAQFRAEARTSERARRVRPRQASPTLWRRYVLARPYVPFRADHGYITHSGAQH